MENIPVPRVQQILKQIKQVEMITWYCTCLKEYAPKPFMMKDRPAPIEILKRISHEQLTGFFGMAEMKDLLQPLCNAAFFLNIQIPKETAVFRKDVPKQVPPMFSSSMLKDIKKMDERLSKLLRKHSKLISEMRNIQQKCQELSLKITERATKKCKEEEIIQKFEKKMKAFGLALVQEKLLRAEICQFSHNIKSSMIKKIKEGLELAFTELKEAFQRIQFPLSHTMSQLTDVDTCIKRMAHGLYNMHCCGYITPIPKDFLTATGYYEILPTTKMICPEVDTLLKSLKGQTKDEAKEFLDPFEEGKGQLNQDNIFFEKKTHGLRVDARDDLPIPAMHGLMGLEKGQEVKVKLRLNGKIAYGFGLTRGGSLFAHKKWGFFSG